MRDTHDSLCNDWNEISARVLNVGVEVSNLVNDLMLNLMNTTEDTKEWKALNKLIIRIAEAQDQLSGLPYLCTPQSEWTGGDNYVVRVPHIVNDA